MAELKFDWSACIVSGGAELINRVEAAWAEYSSVCSEYFDYLVSKAGKTGVHGDRFEESACGFLLLDNLLKKERDRPPRPRDNARQRRQTLHNKPQRH